MREFIWRLIASFVTLPQVTAWLIQRAKLTPYYAIYGPDGTYYMGRWWLFNAYEDGEETDGRDDDLERKAFAWLPSIRIHHIAREDIDRARHDHPWTARTIILRGWYHEERELGPNKVNFAYRRAGYTGRLLFGEFHRINAVSAGGVWTLFFTWKKHGTWGFNVDGVKVPWREYLGLGS